MTGYSTGGGLVLVLAAGVSTFRPAFLRAAILAEMLETWSANNIPDAPAAAQHQL